MTEYSHHDRTFNTKRETIDIPDDAIGVSIARYGDVAVVQYLTPTGDDRCPKCGSVALEPTGAGDECQVCGWHHHG